jgi:hypothetical protein
MNYQEALSQEANDEVEKLVSEGWTLEKKRTWVYLSPPDRSTWVAFPSTHDADRPFNSDSFLDTLHETIEDIAEAKKIAAATALAPVKPLNPSHHLFTPRLRSGTRLRMQLNDEDKAKLGKFRRIQQARVTDQITGLRYAVRSASCGARGCFCDALAKLIA